MRIAVALLGTLAAALPAQAVRQERRTVAWREDLLQRLWLQGRAAPAADAAAIDAALLGDQAGNPFAPLARAAALAAGVDCDAAFTNRYQIHVNALPEVVDPDVPEDGDARVPYRLHVTMHTPYRLATTDAVAFAVELRDAAGEAVWRGRVEPHGAADLAMYAATVAVPMQALPDGPYEVVARATIGEAAPRAHDPVGTAQMLLQRGFVARARELGVRTTELLASSDDVAVRAALYGAIAPVHRVYTGEASDGTPDLAADLRHAVRVLDNVAGHRRPLANATGFFDVAVELAPAPAPNQLPSQLHARVRLPAAGDGAAPLVLFVVGAPTFDGALARPASVRSLPPGWLAQALVAADFDAERRWVCAAVQSVADLDDPVGALAKVIATLGALTAIDGVVLVGEREAANAVLACARPGVLPAPPCGVVVVAGGMLAAAEVEKLETTRVLVVPGRGHLSRENQRRLVQLAQDAGHGDRVRVLEREWAWPWALRMALPEVASFAAAALER